jgi:hypothetical protein|uniref:Trimeric autotransporter adhesin YadA-like head domain-containing protein n=1 Tax=viral metagenome TaxID=1070528 RepID=A0A6C0J0B6_9ZZZZ
MSSSNSGVHLHNINKITFPKIGGSPIDRTPINIGENNLCNQGPTVVIGHESSSNNLWSVVIGYNNGNPQGVYSAAQHSNVIIGRDVMDADAGPAANIYNNVFIGRDVAKTVHYSIGSVCIGRHSANTFGGIKMKFCTLIGAGTNTWSASPTYSYQATAIGQGGYANDYSVCISSDYSAASGKRAVAIGNDCHAKRYGSVVIGAFSTTGASAGDYSVAIGYDSYVGHNNSVVIGRRGQSSASNQLVVNLSGLSSPQTLRTTFSTVVATPAAGTITLPTAVAMLRVTISGTNYTLPLFNNV